MQADPSKPEEQETNAAAASATEAGPGQECPGYGDDEGDDQEDGDEDDGDEDGAEFSGHDEDEQATAPEQRVYRDGDLIDVGGWNCVVRKLDDGSVQIVSNPFKTWQHNTHNILGMVDKFLDLRRQTFKHKQE